MSDILEIIPPPLPFARDDKIFNLTDDEGNIIGEPYSYNDWIKRINDISGVNDELLGSADAVQVVLPDKTNEIRFHGSLEELKKYMPELFNTAQLEDEVTQEYLDEVLRFKGKVNLSHWIPKSPKDTNDGWISVTDRVPEDQQECAVEYLLIPKDCNLYCFCNGKFLDGEFVTCDLSRKINNVISWMPLPKPPKDE